LYFANKNELESLCVLGLLAKQRCSKQRFSKQRFQNSDMQNSGQCKTGVNTKQPNKQRSIQNKQTNSGQYKVSGEREANRLQKYVRQCVEVTPD
jgi:hypothetical protein